MSISMELTVRGREMLSRMLANHHEWVEQGYRMFHHSVWGEGGWKNVDGVRVKKDAGQHIGENNLDVILNPGDYPEESRYYSDDIIVDLDSHLRVEDDQNYKLVVSSILSHIEENNDPFDDSSPMFWEVGLFDNCGYLFDEDENNVVTQDTSYEHNNLIFYATFDAVAKTSNRKFTVDYNIPWIL